MEDETQQAPTSRELPTDCSNCGSTVDPEEWHPSASATDEAGVHRIHVFCDERCQEEWTER